MKNDEKLFQDLKSNWLYCWLIAIFPTILFFILTDIGLHDDAIEYWRLGNNFALTKSYIDHGFHVAYWPPGMAVYVGLIISIFGATIQSVLVANVILQVILIAMVGRLSFLLMGNNIGMISMVLYGWLWDVFKQPSMIMSELPYTFLLVLSFLLFFDSSKRDNYVGAGLAGLILGIAVLIRTTNMLFLPFWLVCLIAVNIWKKRVLTSFALPIVIAFTFFTIPVGLWTYRNFLIFEEIFPISLNSGENLALSNNPYRTYFYLAPDDERREFMNLNQKNHLAVHKAGREIFMDTWREEPITSALYAIPKLRGTFLWSYPWFGMREIVDSKYYHVYDAIILLQWYIYLILIILGFIYFKPKFSHLEIAVFSLILYWVLLHGVIFTDPRYRVPLLPFLIPFMGYAIVMVVPILNRIKREL